MGIQFESEKKKPTKTRRLPYLPRFGVYIDFGGREFTYKQTSIFETVILLQERGLSLANLLKVTKEQFSEIQFPKLKKPKIIDTSAQTISVKTKKK